MSSTLSLFAALAVMTVVAPGPTVLLALNNGARGGLRHALPGIAGAMLSDVVLIGAVAAGLGAVLSTSVLAFETLRWIGAAYLAWLGLRLLRAGRVDAATGSGPDRDSSRWGVLQCSFAVAISNPKGYLFFSALLPSFIDAHAPQAPQYLMLALVFTVIDGAVMLGYATLGSIGRRRWRLGGLRWVERVNGGALLALAAGLALWRRPVGGW